MSRLDQLMKIRDVDPEDADVAYMIAQEHAKAGDHDEAIAWYDRCLEMDGSYHYAYFHKARSQEARDDSAGAASTLELGLDAAKRDQHAKAMSEIESYLGELRA